MIEVNGIVYRNLEEQVQKNKDDIEKLQDLAGSDISELESRIDNVESTLTNITPDVMRALKTPMSVPNTTKIVAVDETNSQEMLTPDSNGFIIENDTIKLKEQKAIDFAENERSKTLNLFNSDISSGWYNGDYGRVPSSEVLSNTNLIDVVPNETYYFSTSSNVDVSDIVFYKDNISNFVTYYVIDSTSFSFTVPSGVNKIGFNFRLGTITDIMLTLGNNYVQYQPYNGAIVHEKDVPLPLKAQMRCKLNSNQTLSTSSNLVLFDNITTIGTNGLIIFDNGVFTFDSSVKYFRIYGQIQTRTTSAIDYNIGDYHFVGMDTAPNSTGVANIVIDTPLIENTGTVTPNLYLPSSSGEIQYWYSYLVVEVY